MKFDAVYYEPAIFDYPLGRQLREEYRDLPWIPIESHNSIREMQEKPNDQFGHMKRNLIANTWKTTRYPIIWSHTPHPAVRPCACTAIWFATIINALISDCL